MLSDEEFYDRLADYYDAMNDWPARLAYEGPFLKRVLEEGGARNVLDAACGTGRHAIALADWGYEVFGADASTRMVLRAQANAVRAGAAIRFETARFSELPSVAPGPFDAVLCIGNSLPHVADQADLAGSLRGMAEVLRSGGLLILHNLNYDRRWREKPKFMKLDSGTIDGQETLIWRLADYEPDNIVFHTALFTRDLSNAWTVQVNSTRQIPLFRILSSNSSNVSAFVRSAVLAI